MEELPLPIPGPLEIISDEVVTLPDWRHQLASGDSD